MRRHYPHKFEAVPGPAKTDLTRPCRHCKLGPGHEVHLLELDGIKAEAVSEPQNLILSAGRYVEPVHINQLQLF